MISFIYFDLGGVIIKDFSGTDKWERFKKDFNISEDYWEEKEPLINKNQFQIDPKLVLAFVERFERNETIWPTLEFARTKFKVGLLTNMYPGMFAQLKNHDLLPKIEWDVVVDSSIEGTCKPEKRIFEIAQERSEVSKKEILFVENTKRNSDVASGFGWQTFWYDSKNYEKSSNSLQEFLRAKN